MMAMKSQITFRQVALIVFAVLVSMAVANYDKLLPRRWETYTAPDGSFSVELPGKPAVETTQAPVEGGGTTALTLVSVKPTSATAYMCSYAEDENIGTKPPDEALESARDGSLSKTEGTLISQKRMTVQGHPALDMQARARGNSLVDSRMIVAGKRLYMIMAVSSGQQDREEKTIQRMFESFKIIKN
jgi:hypothetical protein